MWKRITIIGLLAFSWVNGGATAASAAPKWYEYYTQAQQASQNKEWRRAIDLYLKAIKADPEPSKQKNYGMRYTIYYPYLEIGMAYLAVGDIENAYAYCKQAQNRGIEPKKPVAECVAIAEKYAPKQTPTPTPTATPARSLPPTIRMTSEIPATTEAAGFDARGIASGSVGIREMKVSVENRGLTSNTTFGMTRKPREEFWITIPIEVGRNNVTLEAVDMNGQRVAKTFTVERRLLGQPVIAQKATPVLPPKPTATPQVVERPIEEPVEELSTDVTRPVITLTSIIPETTRNEDITISGVATDDNSMAEVRISTAKTGKGLLLSSATASEREQLQTMLAFEKVVALRPGANTILLEAIDASGNIAKRTMTIVRETAETQAAPGHAPTIPGQRYAVIIGISAYRDERLNLRYTVNDAQGLYDVLTDPNFGGIPKDNIKLLLSEEATTVNVKKAIGTWLSRKATEDDTVIIYYSGHGAPEGDQTYWVTYDADIDDLYSTALNNDEITGMLDRVRAKRVITFLDACYSAATVNRRNQKKGIPTEIPWEKFAGEGRVTISASDGKQESLELDEYRHGLFTYYLLEGLRGNADANRDGVIEIEEVWDFVKRQVTAKARAEGNTQTPVLQGALTAGIALTFDKARIEQTEQKHATEQKIRQLDQLFSDGKLEAENYECAVNMLENGKTDRALENLLAGSLSPKNFKRLFKCVK